MKTLLVLFFISQISLRCPIDDKNCAFCLGDQCQICYDSVLQSGLCSNATALPRPCLFQDGFNICSKCTFGYFLTGDGQCLPLPNSPAQLVPCDVANCTRCNSTNACAECNLGNVLQTDNTCIQAVGIFNNCLRISNGACVQCRYGYYWSNGACVSSRMYLRASGAAALALKAIWMAWTFLAN